MSTLAYDPVLWKYPISKPGFIDWNYIFVNFVDTWYIFLMMNDFPFD